MPTMVLRFPGGRYHATPSGHHVNEGVVEWPPSPWRLMRALIACGYSTQQWHEVPPAGRRLAEALSKVLPVYRLPPAALGHSRHYMPLGRLEKCEEERTLVLDTFADVGDGELWVRWPTEVDSEAQRLFDDLVAHLGYLGRGESWVLGEPISDNGPLPETGHAIPQAEGTRLRSDFEQIALTAPRDPEDYAAWRRIDIASAVSEVARPAGMKLTRAHQEKIDAIQEAYPADLVDCLQRDTAWWKAQKWSHAPGTRTVLYWRRRNALEVGPPSQPRVLDTHRVEMMLLALTTPSGSKSGLPAVTRALPQAELLHSALVSKLGFSAAACPEIVGRDATGEPLKGHRHAHILPCDLDTDGRLDHIVVYAPMGLGAHAQRAVRSLRQTYMKGGVGELQVAVAGAGSLNDFRSIGPGMARAVDELLGSRSAAVSWITTTPFVPPRYLKKNGRSSLVGQLEEELDSRGFPPARIGVLDWSGDRRALRHFVRRRRRGPQPPVDIGFAIRLVFDSPVFGPICLGYGSHFGLGRFRPTAEPDQK